MHSLALLFPQLQSRRFLLSRDQWVLFLVAVNQFFLSLDTYLVHVLNGTIVIREWIPIVFGVVAGVLLLLAGLVALRFRKTAVSIAILVFIASMIVGVMGAYFHFVRGIQPTAPLGQRVTITLLIWAPPVLAPFAFAGVAIMGVSAALQESPVDSGRLKIFSRWVQLPYSKTQAYLFLVTLGILVALVSSVLDHARSEWSNPRLWVPVVVGLFATAVSTAFTFINKPHRGDVTVYLFAMVLLIIVGALGAFFHVQADLTASRVFVIERFLRGAPFLSPLLFSNMGFIGLIVLLDPTA